MHLEGLHGRKDEPVRGRVLSRHGFPLAVQSTHTRTPYLAACWRFLRRRALPVFIAATRASRSPFAIARASAASSWASVPCFVDCSSQRSTAVLVVSHLRPTLRPGRSPR